MRWSIEDFVYGGTDGAVTTFAIVSGDMAPLYLYQLY
jgi:hypothetical protein